MTLTGREAPEMAKEQAAPAGLLAALTWERPSEKKADPILWAPRTITYQEEAEKVMEAVKAGRRQTFQPEIELVGAQIASLCEAWEGNVAFAMPSHEEARQLDPKIDG
jgi:hypothetical protein